MVLQPQHLIHRGRQLGAIQQNTPIALDQADSQGGAE